MPEDRRLTLQELEHLPRLVLDEAVVIEQVDVVERERRGHAWLG